MDNRNEAKAPKISLWDTQQLLEALRRNKDSVTAAKCANLKGTISYKPICQDARCFNREFIEGYI